MLPAVTTNVGIGVNPDPNTTPDSTYLTNDYSLTITSNIVSTVQYPNYQTLHKVGGGNLILPNPNAKFFGNFSIDRGWVTIQDSNSLGAHVTTYNTPFGVKGIGDTQQPTVTVQNGAALHLDPISGNISVPQNMVLAGKGLTGPSYGLIKQMAPSKTSPAATPSPATSRSTARLASASRASSGPAI